MSRPAPSDASSPLASAVRGDALRRYVIAVGVAGGGVLGFLLVRDGLGRISRAPVTFVLLSILLTVGEGTPARVRRRNEDASVTASTMFAFALLLAYGAGPAVLGLLAASVIVDSCRRLAPMKIAFNASVYAVALGLAGLTYEWLAPVPLPTDRPFTAADFAPLVAAWAVFGALNVILLNIALSLYGGHSARLHQLRVAPLQVLESGVSVALSPIVVVVADHSLWLIAVLALPLAGVYRSARLVVSQEHEALHDVLTGLANRTLFEDRVEQGLLQAGRTATSIAVMLLDLDRFKEVNDTLGHQAGDELLREVGRRLEETVRDSDTVARLGGDEFAVLVTGARSPADATDVAERIADALAAPFVTHGAALDVLGSIGIALSPVHGEDFETLLKRADAAMYRAKSTRSGYQLYRARPGESDQPGLDLLDEVRAAVAGGQVAVRYLPTVDLGSGDVTAVEALACWDRPGHGVVAHHELTVAAERAGLTRPLTRHVLDHALAQCRRWMDQGVALPVAVNLSARDLQDRNLAAEIAEALEGHAVPPQLLEVDVTEAVVMADPRCARATLTALGAMGVRLAVDDFGNGSSSLGLMARLPLSLIRISASFVRAMADDVTARAAVGAAIALARALGAAVVGEGVDRPESRRLLVELGCDAGQGDLLGVPLAADEFTRWRVEVPT